MSYDGRKREPTTLPVKFPCCWPRGWKASPWA